VSLRESIRDEMDADITAAVQATVLRMAQRDEFDAPNRSMHAEWDPSAGLHEAKEVLRVAYFVLKERVVQPWPALLVHLLARRVDLQPVFIELLTQSFTDLIQDPFEPGASVLFYHRDERRWNSGRVHKVSPIEVIQKDQIIADLKPKHVLSQATSGVGALLLEAARKGQARLVELLLEAKVSPFYSDRHANTALMVAAKARSPGVCQVLRLKGADINLFNRFRENAFDVSVIHKDTPSFRALKPSKAYDDLALSEDHNSDPLSPPTPAESILQVARSGDVDVLRRQLQWVEEPELLINTPCGAGRITALMAATQAGHFKMVQKLLELKGNTLLKSRSSALAVTIAAEEGRVDVIKALLAHRREEQIDFSAYDSGRTPLLVASQYGHADVADVLIRTGADMSNARQGMTPMHLAAMYGHDSVLRLLLSELSAHTHSPVLESGGSFKKDRKESQHLASAVSKPPSSAPTSFNYKEGAASPHGSDRSHGGSHGRSPSHAKGSKHRSSSSSSSSSSPERESPPKANSARGPHRAAAPEAAPKMQQHRSLGAPAVLALMGSGWVVSPLMLAARYGHSLCCSLLLDGGAAVNQGDDKGWTSLHRAAGSGHLVVLEILLAKGGQVNQCDDKGTSPLAAAATSGQVDVVHLLLSHKADVNMRNERGETTLSIACSYGHEAVVRELFSFGGVDAWVRDKKGRTPLMAAAETGSEGVVQIMLDHSRRARTDTPQEARKRSNSTYNRSDQKSSYNDGRADSDSRSRQGSRRSTRCPSRSRMRSRTPSPPLRSRQNGAPNSEGGARGASLRRSRSYRSTTPVRRCASRAARATSPSRTGCCARSCRRPHGAQSLWRSTCSRPTSRR